MISTNLLIVSLLIAGLVLIPVYAQDLSESTYTSTFYGLSFQYPEKWIIEQTEREDSTIILHGSHYKSENLYLTISVESNHNNLTFDEIVENKTIELQNTYDNKFKILQEKNLVLSNLPAKEIVYEYYDENENVYSKSFQLKNLETIVYGDNFIITIQYYGKKSIFANQLSEARSIINSLEIDRDKLNHDLTLKNNVDFLLFYIFVPVYFLSVIFCYFREKRRGKFKTRFLISIIILGVGLLYMTYYTPEVDIISKPILFIGLLVGCILILFIKPGKKKRRHFDNRTKREILKKQDYKCAICGKKFQQYGYDFDHKNNDRSNNTFSNCQALCTPCHREKSSRYR